MSEQVPTRAISAQAIMRSAAFVAGVEDVRNGRPPDYDAFTFNQGEEYLGAASKITAHWNYERGRQWASLAPRLMPLKIGAALNPKAVALFCAAAKRGYIAR
jgi:hypothetical protein